MGNSQAVAIVALLLNILLLPGLGSIIGGKTTHGIIQIVLAGIAFLLTITLIGAIIGIPLGIGVWIWALISGIQIVKEADK